MISDDTLHALDVAVEAARTELNTLDPIFEPALYGAQCDVRADLEQLGRSLDRLRNLIAGEEA